MPLSPGGIRFRAICDNRRNLTNTNLRIVRIWAVGRTFADTVDDRTSHNSRESANVAVNGRTSLAIARVDCKQRQRRRREKVDG